MSPQDVCVTPAESGNAVADAVADAHARAADAFVARTLPMPEKKPQVRALQWCESFNVARLEDDLNAALWRFIGSKIVHVIPTTPGFVCVVFERNDS